MSTEDFLPRQLERTAAHSCCSETLSQAALATYQAFKAADSSRASGADGMQFLCFSDGPKGAVSAETIESYKKSFENLMKNGATNRETLDAFKKVCDSLPDLDEKALGKALDQAAKNGKVDMRLVAQHVKEILQSNGFKLIGGTLDKTEGGLLMKNDATETYIDIGYRQDGKRNGSRIIIENNGKKTDG